MHTNVSGNQSEQTVSETEKYMGSEQNMYPWPLVRERTIPTDNRHLSAKLFVHFWGQRGVARSARWNPHGR
jgi:hypothetical protein